MTEEEHKRLMAEAVEEIMGSTALRHFVRNVFSDCGLHDSFGVGTPAEVAYVLGRHSVGMQIRQTLEETRPTAFAELLYEDTKLKLDDGDSE